VRVVALLTFHQPASAVIQSTVRDSPR
jgi:hypothetical protein